VYLGADGSRIGRTVRSSVSDRLEVDCAMPWEQNASPKKLIRPQASRCRYPITNSLERWTKGQRSFASGSASLRRNPVGVCQPLLERTTRRAPTAGVSKNQESNARHQTGSFPLRDDYFLLQKRCVGPSWQEYPVILGSCDAGAPPLANPAILKTNPLNLPSATC
jgi:hypothetical protein